jgi:large subunit ribosomal protein L9
MKVILQEHVDNQGNPGEIVNVSDGYARNYLIPRKMAVQATPQAIKISEQSAAKRAKLMEEIKAKQQKLADELIAAPVTITVTTGKEEQLFGSVTVSDIAAALKEKGFEIDRKKIHLRQPIRALGNYTVPVKLHPEITANLQVTVASKEATPAASQ